MIFFLFLAGNPKSPVNTSWDRTINTCVLCITENQTDSTAYKPRLFFPECEDLTNDAFARYACAEKNFQFLIYENIRYPEKAFLNKIQGTVIVSFVITSSGEMTNIAIVRDASHGLGDAAVIAFEKIREKNLRWLPAFKDGKPVDFTMTWPVKFLLAP